jgi:hypothetical protein
MNRGASLLFTAMLATSAQAAVIDDSFGSAGRAVLELNGASSQASAGVLQPVTSVDIDGNPLTSVEIARGANQAFALLIGADGKLLIGGSTGPGTANDRNVAVFVTAC